MTKDRPASDKDDVQNGVAKQSLFLDNLEQWIDEKISQDGLADKELVETIRDKFERAMQANIDHHEFMMKSAKENDDGTKAGRHRLMADVYRALIE